MDATSYDAISPFNDRGFAYYGTSTSRDRCTWNL